MPIQQGRLFPLPDSSATLLSHRISDERLPTNTTTYRHPIHRWFNFIAGFSPEFVGLCVANSKLGGNATLLDPFAGCATAPLTACQLGLSSVGYEPHPVLARIARAKLPDKTASKRLLSIERAISSGLRSPLSANALPAAPRAFLSKLLPADALEALLGAKESLRSQSLLSDDLAFVVLSKMLDLCSHSQTDGIYKAPTSRKASVAPSCALEDTIKRIATDIDASDSTIGLRSRIFQASSQRMKEVDSQSIDIVVTSPPYLNNFDFAEMTRMYLYFWGIANSWREITETVRSQLIVNTTTALKGHKECQADYRQNVPLMLRGELDSLVEKLRAERQLRPGKKEYDLLVYPYFSQVTDVLRECHRCLKPGALIHIMIADAALYGTHISTPQILRDVLSCIGYSGADCALVRKRGHRWILDKRDGSPTGLGEYHVRAIRP